MKIKASAEDYLETILVLTNKLGKVRAIDIAAHMGFSKPTISIQMKQFRENGYITEDATRHISLTEKGMEIALQIHERHTLISNILISIGVDQETAYADACKIEHNLSDQTFNCLKNYYEKAILTKKLF